MKVQKGAARTLFAANYLNEADKMNFYQKLSEFKRLNSLNERAVTKTLHVSLNFDSSEKLVDNRLIEIANDYMERIGFGKQPYLVYKHLDAAHPHIHIVSTTIQKDGSRISTHNIGRNQSEKARKEIELKFRLIRAERQQHLTNSDIKPLQLERAAYGKSETKRSISNIVTAIFSQYKFSSLPEFNAALKQYNVVADRGQEEGRIYKNHGLIYRILDAEGNKVGVPIKASSIGCRPILSNLEQRFTMNEPAKESLKQRIKNAIDDCLQSSSGNMKSLAAALAQKQIYAVLRQNSKGRLYGITFVDNQNKVVFNGSDLGKGYSAAALQNRVVIKSEKSQTPDEAKESSLTGKICKDVDLQKHREKAATPIAKSEGLLDILLSTKEQYDNTPSGLLGKKRKKKRKNRDF